MKKEHFFLLFLMIISSWNVHAQSDQNITIKFDHIPSKESVLQLEKISDFTFYFDADWLKGQFVSKDFENESLRNVWKRIFENINIK